MIGFYEDTFKNKGHSLIEQSKTLGKSECEAIFCRIMKGDDGFYDDVFIDEDAPKNFLRLDAEKFQQALRIRALCRELTDDDRSLDVEACVSNPLETALKKAAEHDWQSYQKNYMAIRSKAIPAVHWSDDEDQDLKERLMASIRASVNGDVSDDERWGELRFQALFCQGHVVLWNAPHVLEELASSYIDSDFDEIMQTPDYFALRALRLVNPLVLVELKLRGLMRKFTDFLYWYGRNYVDVLSSLSMKEDSVTDVVLWDHACSWLSCEVMKLPQTQYFKYNPDWQKLCSRHAALMRNEMEQNVLKELYVINEREEDYKKTWEYLNKHSLTGFFADDSYEHWFKVQDGLDPNKFYFLPTISKCMSVHKRYAPVLWEEYRRERSN